MSQEISPPTLSQGMGARALPLLLLLLLWQLAASHAQSKALPLPQAVFQVLLQELHSGELLLHLQKTLLRVAISFVLAMLIGVLLGMSMGRSARLNRWLDGVLILGLNIPVLVTTILCYIWFGLTEEAAILAVVINKVPMVAINLREGARAVNQDLLEVARAYRVAPRARFFKVYLPQLYPYLFSSARNGLALIWKIVLVVELLGRSDGIGFQIGNFFHFFDIASVLAYTLAFSAVIFLIELALLRPLEKHLNRWRP